MTILHWIGDRLRDLFMQVPLPVARGLFLALPAAVLLWVLLRPQSENGDDHATNRQATHLKLGAVIALVAQLVIYLLF